MPPFLHEILRIAWPELALPKHVNGGKEIKSSTSMT